MNLYPAQRKRTEKLVLFIIGLLALFAISAQFYLIILNREESLIKTVVRFFSFFTIPTNLIVAVCCTILFAGKHSKLYSFFSKYSTLTAIAVYILIVGIIYNTILRALWQPKELQKITDELLHSIVPVLFFLYWIIFVPKQNIGWRNAFVWLIYPAVYTIYTLVHGLITNYYPYAFINIKELGFAKALINGCMILLAFFLLSFLLISIGKIKNEDSIVD